MKTKEFKFALSDEGINENGKFTGYASIFGVVDSYGDTVESGAFKRTLKAKKEFPMLWSHNVYEPIGIITGEEDSKGLIVQGQFNLDVQRAREIRSLMAQKAVNGLSIGYNTVKEIQDRETNTRRLKEVKLYEISPCVFQACPGALVDSVKAEELATLLEPIYLMTKETVGVEHHAIIEKAQRFLSALINGDSETSTPQIGDPHLDNDLDTQIDQAMMDLMQDFRSKFQMR